MEAMNNKEVPSGCLAMLPCLGPVPDEDDRLFEDEQNWEVPEELTYDIQAVVRRHMENSTLKTRYVHVNSAQSSV